MKPVNPLLVRRCSRKEQQNGTVTDMNGRYSLEVPEGGVLQISYIGYNTQEVKVGSGDVVNVSLREIPKPWMRCGYRLWYGKS